MTDGLLCVVDAAVVRNACCCCCPLLLGPCFGIISDRYDRRRTVAISLATMSAITYTVAAAL